MLEVKIQEDFLVELCLLVVQNEKLQRSEAKLLLESTRKDYTDSYAHAFDRILTSEDDPLLSYAMDFSDDFVRQTFLLDDATVLSGSPFSTSLGQMNQFVIAGAVGMLRMANGDVLVHGAGLSFNHSLFIRSMVQAIDLALATENVPAFTADTLF